MEANKYLTWKNKNYNKDAGGYFHQLIPCQKTYFTESGLLTEYNKQKLFCEDEVYKKFKFGSDFDLYF